MPATSPGLTALQCQRAARSSASAHCASFYPCLPTAAACHCAVVSASRAAVVCVAPTAHLSLQYQLGCMPLYSVSSRAVAVYPAPTALLPLCLPIPADTALQWCSKQSRCRMRSAHCASFINTNRLFPTPAGQGMPLRCSVSSRAAVACPFTALLR
jgi:hypothetical protein